MIATLLEAKQFTPEPGSWEASMIKVWIDQEHLHHDANLSHEVDFSTRDQAEAIIGELKRAYKQFNQQDRVSILF